MKSLIEEIAPSLHAKGLSKFNNLIIRLKLHFSGTEKLTDKEINQLLFEDSKEIRKELESCKERMQLKY